MHCRPCSSGELLAPRLVGFVARSRSQEALLVTGLTLCFGLALVAEQLGVLAAAGAFLFRSADAIASALDRMMPGAVKQYLSSLAVWMATLRGTLGARSEAARAIQRSARMTMLNLGIVMAIVAAATVTLGYISPLTRFSRSAKACWGF
ncbi:MAG: hypothetical protein Q8P22_08240 [Chloroflexota bacterium]|nr:hypothetical protein [Chloroflexota bacterium]